MSNGQNGMWNRKNSVAIQSYSAQNSKPDLTEVDRKRVSFENVESLSDTRWPGFGENFSLCDFHSSLPSIFT